MDTKKLWIYPLLFGITGAFLGLLIRYAFTGAEISFTFKNVLHAHSHVMMLGFLFNAMLLLVWSNFTKAVDTVSYRLYIALQVCLLLMMLAFLWQGYAFFSILFSTLHLWIGYILLIRLWKRLEGSKEVLIFVKAGIVFYFLSSLGPYTLGPLMALKMKHTPWYQQAVFFYLHFQFMGVYFSWLFALMVKKLNISISGKLSWAVVIGIIFLYAHSLDFSFDHPAIHFFGGLGSTLIFAVLFTFYRSVLRSVESIQWIYLMLVLVALVNIAGSFPFFANLAIDNRNILIAWLHLLFLGLYIPFIWIFTEKRIRPIFWILYLTSVLLSEILLIFPDIFGWTHLPVNDLLFYTYFGVFAGLTLINIRLITGKTDLNLIRNQ